MVLVGEGLFLFGVEGRCSVFKCRNGDPMFLQALLFENVVAILSLRSELYRIRARFRDRV